MSATPTMQRFAMPATPAVGSTAAITDSASSLGVTLESGHAPVMQRDYSVITQAAPQYMPPSAMGFYAEQVILPPSAPAPSYGMHVPPDGEAFNYSYVAKCVDPAQQQEWHGKGSTKDFRALGTEAHSPANCKANGNCSVCNTKNFVVSEPTGKVRQKHHGTKTYHCTMEDCDKTFITRKEQQNHIARHMGEPRYYCEYPGCTCKYTTKSSLDLHMTRIHAEKRFRCDQCEERYSVKGDLNQHMKRKHMKQQRR